MSTSVAPPVSIHVTEFAFASTTARPLRIPNGCGADEATFVCHARTPAEPPSVEPRPPLPPRMYVELRLENESKTSASDGVAAGVGAGAGVWPGLFGLEKSGAVESTTNRGMGHP